MSLRSFILFAAMGGTCWTVGIKNRLTLLEIQVNQEAFKTKSDMMELRDMIRSLNTSDRSAGENCDEEAKATYRTEEIAKPDIGDNSKIEVLVSAFREEKIAIRKEIQQIRDTCEKVIDINYQSQDIQSEVNKSNKNVKLNKESIDKVERNLFEIDEKYSAILENYEQSMDDMKTRIAELEKRNNDFLTELGDLKSNFKQKVADIIDSLPQKRVCPDTWIKYEDECYFYDEERKLNWTSALQACRKLGGKLVEPDTKEKVNYILNVTDGKAVWLGASDLTKEGVYNIIWESTNLPVENVPWVAGQPNNFDGDQDCIECEHSGLNDEGCHYKNHLFCEM